MYGPTPQGQVWPATFYSGAASSATGPVLLPPTRPFVIQVVTFIAVVFDGTGGAAPLISFSLNGGAPLWASAPSGGTVHTEQFPCWLPIFNPDQLVIDPGSGNWGVLVSGLTCTDPSVQ